LEYIPVLVLVLKQTPMIEGILIPWALFPVDHYKVSSFTSGPAETMIMNCKEGKNEKGKVW